MTFSLGNLWCHPNVDTGLNHGLVWADQANISFRKSVLPSQFGHRVEPWADLEGPSAHFHLEISAVISVWMSQSWFGLTKRTFPLGNLWCHPSVDTGLNHGLVWTDLAHISFGKSVPLSQSGHRVEPWPGLGEPRAHFHLEISTIVPVWMSQTWFGLTKAPCLFPADAAGLPERGWLWVHRVLPEEGQPGLAEGAGAARGVAALRVPQREHRALHPLRGEDQSLQQERGGPREPHGHRVLGRGR